MEEQRSPKPPVAGSNPAVRAKHFENSTVIAAYGSVSKLAKDADCKSVTKKRCRFEPCLAHNAQLSFFPGREYGGCAASCAFSSVGRASDF